MNIPKLNLKPLTGQRLSPQSKLSAAGAIRTLKIVASLTALTLCAMCSIAYADYEFDNQGDWPRDWPKELEPLRPHARTLVGPIVPQPHYEIPFTSREEFEAAWPHLLQVKSKGAPVILVRGPKTDFMEVKPAGVLIHSPPAGTDRQANPEAPIPGVTNVRERWMNTTFIELVVDGTIVDLNRIPLPADTPIIDERF